MPYISRASKGHKSQFDVLLIATIFAPVPHIHRGLQVWHVMHQVNDKLHHQKPLLTEGPIKAWDVKCTMVRSFGSICWLLWKEK